MLDDDLARVLDKGYVGDVSTLGTSELKARRADAQEVEAKVSYLRRLVQGRLDIVTAELDRRAQGAPAGDLSALVEQLPQILADRVRAPGPGRLPTNLAPPEDVDETAELDEAAGAVSPATLPDLSEDELREVSDRLRELEQRVSGERRAVFDVIDTLQAELTSRLERGNA
jgi:hypothetical protein